MATANNRLLALVERKYEHKELANPQLEARIAFAIEERQRLKQRILSHQCSDEASTEGVSPRP